MRALVITVALIAIAVADMRGVTMADLHSSVYSGVDGYPCVLLLDANQGSTSVSGTLQYLETLTDVSAFEKDSIFGSTVTVLSSSLFTRTIVERLGRTGHLSGIAVLRSDTIPGGQSPDSKRPNSRFGLNQYDWNPIGDDFLWQSYKFPIWLVEGNASAVLKQRALQNAAKPQAYPRWGLSFHTQMTASHDSATCIRRGQCLPIGGQSLWGTAANFSASKPVIFATATMDSNSFFHDIVPGVDAHLSGAIALIAAHVALSKLDMSDAHDQVAFGYFSGEAWDNIGSRKFVKDLQSFTCVKPSTVVPFHCDQPYETSTKFTQLKLQDFTAVVDVSQLSLRVAPGDTPTMFIHQQDPSDVSSGNIAKYIQNTALASVDLDIDASTVSGTNGIPPSPAVSFYKARQSIPAIVLAEHQDAFTNNYFHSHMDTERLNSSVLCQASTLIARSLHTIAYRRISPLLLNITADCALVDQLVECLTRNFKCPLVEKYLGPLTPTQGNDTVALSYYVGVYGATIDSPAVHPAVYFLRDLLLDRVSTVRGDFNCSATSPCPSGLECVGTAPNTQCVAAPIYYHVALPLGIDWDYGGGSWKIANQSESCWTESYWGSLSTEMFQLDDPMNDLAMLLSGLGAIAISIVTIIVCRMLLRKHYKLA